MALAASFTDRVTRAEDVVTAVAVVPTVVVGVVVVKAASAVMSGIGTDVLADRNVSALWAALTTAVEFAVPKPFNELNR